MKTSNFANWQRQRFPGAISISRYPDKRSGFNGPEFTPLMPSASLLRWYKQVKSEPDAWAAYEALYNEQLDCLNAEKCFHLLTGLALDSDESDEPVLLCYESAKTLDTQPCHRRLVAAWFHRELGIEVPEWEKVAA